MPKQKKYLWYCRDCESRFDRAGGNLAEGNLCPNCKSNQLNFITYCEECGSEIPEGDVAFDYEGEAIILDGLEHYFDMVCAHCWFKAE